MSPEEDLQQAIALIKAGKKSEAIPILILMRNIKIPRNYQKTNHYRELAWLWLSECLDEPVQRKRCFEMAEIFNPDNEQAKKGFEQWIWLSEGLDYWHQKKWFFEQALNFNPNNEKAKKALEQLEFNLDHRKKYIYFTRTSSKKFYIALKLLNDVSYEIIQNPYPLDDSENYIVTFKPEQTEYFYLFYSLLYGMTSESDYFKFNVYGFHIIQLSHFCDASETRAHHYYRDWSELKKAAFDDAIKRLIDYYGVSDKYDLYPLLKKDIMDKYGISERHDYIAAYPPFEKTPEYKEKLKQIEHEMIMCNELPSKWKSEQDMFKIIKREYPDAIFHYIADWISPQHLDVFVPSIGCAFEYQGIQHFMSIDYFGGKKSLKKRKSFDKRKHDLCKTHGVHLIEWHYSEPLTKTMFLSKLAD